jgi:hypothetical protein
MLKNELKRMRYMHKPSCKHIYLWLNVFMKWF